MRTLVCDPPPAGIEALLQRRKRYGQDRHDEAWEGVLHMVPAPSGEHSDLAAEVKALLRAPATAAGLRVSDEFNLGDCAENFRVPDGGLHRTRPRGSWIHTAALVLEILSPGDETWQKLAFYATREVDELLIVDPEKRTVDWLGLAGHTYEPIDRSHLIELDPHQLTLQIDWP